MYKSFYINTPPGAQFIGPPAGQFHLGSSIIVASVGLLCKTFLKSCAHFHLLHPDNMHRLFHRPSHQPVITYSNHVSTLDDPTIWGAIPTTHLLQRQHMRFAMAAHDVCFNTSFRTWFFSQGQCLPVMRGGGVYQGSMNHAVQLLNEGRWVHIYPEGKVNHVSDEILHFKWGIGRLVMDSLNDTVSPWVVPIYHHGMHDVLPEHHSLPRLWKTVAIAYGQPMDFRELISAKKAEQASLDTIRAEITRQCYERLLQLQKETKHYLSLHS